MENHHLAAAFGVIQSPEFNFMGKVPKVRGASILIHTCSDLAS